MPNLSILIFQNLSFSMEPNLDSNKKNDLNLYMFSSELWWLISIGVTGVDAVIDM